jgi:hypothetical protein
MRETQAGRLLQFTERDYAAAANGMTQLIEALNKTVKTMNPEDPDTRTLKSGVDELGRLKGQLQKTYDSIKDVNI